MIPDQLMSGTANLDLFEIYDGTGQDLRDRRYWWMYKDVSVQHDRLFQVFCVEGGVQLEVQKRGNGQYGGVHLGVQKGGTVRMVMRVYGVRVLGAQFCFVCVVKR